LYATNTNCKGRKKNKGGKSIKTCLIMQILKCSDLRVQITIYSCIIYF
jgi:hypothetical protein